MIQRDRPLLSPVSGPGPREPGLHLLRVEPSLTAEEPGALASGRLLIPIKSGGRAALDALHGLSVTVISERDQAVFTARLLARQPLASGLPAVADNSGLCGVDFSFDLGASMALDLWTERFFVVLGARELVSELVIYEHEGANAQQTEAMARGLGLAYAALRQGNLEYAYRVFRSALSDETLAADLDGSHRYHAACVACLLADQRRAQGGTMRSEVPDQAVEVDDSELLGVAMAWLDQEAAQLAGAWDRISAGHAQSSDPADLALYTGQLDELRARIAWMRHDDPDLARLRGELKIDPRLRGAGMLDRLG